jgi:hypothetical protein
MIITILRKPLEGSVADNTLKHGCGALNIDATRVGAESRTYKGSGKSEMVYSESRAGMSDGRGKDMEFSVEGRWPANFILTHLEGCTSQEEVADWACVEGCPVKELDRQSGRVKGWSSQNHNTFNPYQGNSFHNSSTQRQGYKEGYNDVGGASRFFKQFKKGNN